MRIILGGITGAALAFVSIGFLRALKYVVCVDMSPHAYTHSHARSILEMFINFFPRSHINMV